MLESKQKEHAYVNNNRFQLCIGQNNSLLHHNHNYSLCTCTPCHPLASNKAHYQATAGTTLCTVPSCTRAAGDILQLRCQHIQSKEYNVICMQRPCALHFENKGVWSMTDPNQIRKAHVLCLGFGLFVKCIRFRIQNLNLRQI